MKGAHLFAALMLLSSSLAVAAPPGRASRLTAVQARARYNPDHLLGIYENAAPSPLMGGRRLLGSSHYVKIPLTPAAKGAPGVTDYPTKIWAFVPKSGSNEIYFRHEYVDFRDGQAHRYAKTSRLTIAPGQKPAPRLLVTPHTRRDEL